MELEKDFEITIGEPVAAKVLDTCVGAVCMFFVIYWVNGFNQLALISYHPVAERT